MTSKALMVLAALAVAQPASAATSFFTEIHEGQYQTFTLNYEGPQAPQVWINGYDPLYYKYSPDGIILISYINQVDKFCAIPSGTSSCNTGYVNVRSTSWENTISLYVEFVMRSYDFCDKVEYGLCASKLPPFNVTAFALHEEGDFEVLSSGGGAVPEPATWAMMILGFGLVGAALRRRANAEFSL